MLPSVLAGCRYGVHPAPVPEGDTIFRAARHLRRALVGRPVLSFELGHAAADAPGVVGAPVHAVESRGKNLLIHLGADWVLYTHMQMSGSWHIYRPGEAWRKSPDARVARLHNPDFVAVCFSAPVVELLTRARVERHPVLSRLGPDLLAEAPELERMRAGLLAPPNRALGVALLDQRAVAGIGNVYKSELCFQEKLDPFAPVGSVPPERLEQLLRRAARSLRENLDTFRRTTRRGPGGRHWVYGRVGQPCYTCSTPVGLRRQGDAGRSTYFCPRCQGVRFGKAASG